MKRNIYIILFASAAMFSACEMDQFPESGIMTEEQKNAVVSDDASKISGDLNSLKDNLIQFGTVSTSTNTYHNDYGFPSLCLTYDMAGQDMVSEDVGFNWFSSQLTFSDRIPTSTINKMIWKLHYQHIKTANNILTKMYTDYPNEADRTGEAAKAIGEALASRAFDYLQLIQTYQFTYLGNEEKPGLPLVDEKLTLEQSTNNPRVSVQKVYDMIMNDLNRSISMFEVYGSTERPDKAEINIAVAYGLRARAHMLLGNYAEAANDADQALILSGATPYTMNEVSVPAFNEDNHSWIWGCIITSNNDVVTTGIINWPSHLCSLTGNGYTTGTDGTVYRRINVNLWNQIPETDVRKAWWVDEDLQSSALNNAYGAATGKIIGPELGYAPYTNVKFGPEANMLTNTENAQDWPLMRAEEMLLIKAEALARSQSISVGKTVLEDFVRTYRNPSYVCTASSLDAFINEIWLQRRIELWGEGFSLFDVLRLKKPIVRIGANFSSNVTYADIAPESPILIYCIPECETSTNKGIPTDNINEVATPPVPVN